MPSTSTDRIDGLSTSMAIKVVCLYTTSANIALSGLGVQSGGTWIDDLAEGVRIFAQDQTNPVDNGIWIAGIGTWSRAKDFDGARDATQGTLIPVYRGIGTYTIYALSTENPIYIGTTELEFEIVTDAALSGNLANTSNAALGDALIGVKKTGGLATTQHIVNEGRYFDFVADFGGVGDGVTDNWAAFSAAITACKLHGKKLWIPAGNYLINTAGGSIDIERVCIEGEGIYAAGAPYTDKGTVISIIGTTNSPFNLKRSWTFKGINFFWPNITDTNPPLAHPPLLKGTYITQGLFDGCSVINAYDFLKVNIGSAGLGDVRFSNCRIFAVNKTWDFANGVGEVLQISNCLFSFGVYEDVATLSTYLLPYFTTNGEFMHCDTSGGSVAAVSVQMSNVVLFGYRTGIRVLSGNFGIEAASSVAFDAVGTWLSVEGTGTFNNNPFVGCIAYCYKFGDTAAKASGLYAHGGLCQINLTGMELAYSQGHAVDIGGTVGTTLQFEGGRVAAWGQTTFATPAEYQAFAISDSGLTGKISTSLYANPVGSNTYAGVGVANAAKLDVVGSNFHACNISVHVTGGTRVNVRDCSSTGTVTKDIVYATPGVVRASDNDWSMPGATIGYPIFRAAKATSQTFNSGTATVSAFATESFDLDGTFASNAETVSQPGIHRYKTLLTHDATGTAGDVWTIGFFVAGVQVSSFTYTMIAAANSVSHSDDLLVAAGNVVDVRVTRSSGAGVFATVNDATNNYFTGELIQSVG